MSTQHSQNPFTCSASNDNPASPTKGLGKFLKNLLNLAERSVTLCFWRNNSYELGDGQPHIIIEGAGHFLQEDKPNELAQIINTFIASK